MTNEAGKQQRLYMTWQERLYWFPMAAREWLRTRFN